LQELGTDERPDMDGDFHGLSSVRILAMAGVGILGRRSRSRTGRRSSIGDATAIHGGRPLSLFLSFSLSFGSDPIDRNTTQGREREEEGEEREMREAERGSCEGEARTEGETLTLTLAKPEQLHCGARATVKERKHERTKERKKEGKEAMKE
jgi:hypothetical protein